MTTKFDIDDLNLPDPDMVGATEYRAIYDTISDALDQVVPIAGTDPGQESRLVALGILQEFLSHAAGLRVAMGFCDSCTGDLGYRERCENNDCHRYGESQGS